MSKTIMFSILLLSSIFSYGNNDKPLSNSDKEQSQSSRKHITWGWVTCYKIHLPPRGKNGRKASKLWKEELWNKECGYFHRSCRYRREQCRKDGGLPRTDVLIP